MESQTGSYLEYAELKIVFIFVELLNNVTVQTMKSKSKRIKIITLIAVLFSAGISVNGSSLKEPEYEEKFIQRVLLLENFINLSNPVTIEIDHKAYDEQGRLKSFYVRSDGGQLLPSAFSVSPNFKVSLKWVDGEIQEATCTSFSCKEDLDDYSISGGLPYARSRHSLITDKNGTVTGGNYNSRGYGKVGKKHWEKHFFVFDFFPTGKIKSIKEMVSAGKGKNVREVTPVFDYCQKERRFFENDPAKTEIISYKRLYKKRDDPEIQRSVLATCIREDDEITTTIRTKNKVKESTSQNKWFFNEKNLPIRAVYSNKEILISYNENELVSKVDVLSFTSENVKKSRDEFLFTYVSQDKTESKSSCEFESKVSRNYYDDNDVLIREEKDGHARFRNDDGSWSDWKFLKY